MLGRYRRFRYWWGPIPIVLVLGLGAVLGARASATAPRCAPGQAVHSCAVAFVTDLLAPGQCEPEGPAFAGGPEAQPAEDRLQDLIEDVPCPDTGRVSYDTTDNLGESMSVLDTVPDPRGGYLGVYHTEFRTPGVPGFRISLAHSSDLINWTRLEVLDPTGASMPTLRPIPGARGYMLAYEKRGHSGGDVIRVRYYRTLEALLVNHYVAQLDLPRMFSPWNNGTPTILWIHWNGALRRSQIELGFHYQSAIRGAPGPDREAVGVLRGFHVWSAHTDPSTDIGLDRQGLFGSHGDWRQFGFDGEHWRVYEAQTTYNNFGSWRVVLADPATEQMYSLALRAGSDPVSSSFANPVASEEPAPNGHGTVLVITMYLFSARVPGTTGELVYYQPI